MRQRERLNGWESWKKVRLLYFFGSNTTLCQFRGVVWQVDLSVSRQNLCILVKSVNIILNKCYLSSIAVFSIPQIAFRKYWHLSIHLSDLINETQTCRNTKKKRNNNLSMHFYGIWCPDKENKKWIEIWSVHPSSFCAIEQMLKCNCMSLLKFIGGRMDRWLSNARRQQSWPSSQFLFSYMFSCHS